MKNILSINTYLLLSILLFPACNQAPAHEAAQEPAEHQDSESQDMAELTEEQYQVAGIVLGKAEMRSLSRTLAVTGELDLPPQNVASVSAPMGGFMKSTELLEGMRVKKGQLIARIENPDFITMQQDYLEAVSNLEYLKLEYERQKELSEEQVSAAKVFQKTTAEYKSMQVRVQALEEKLRLIGVQPSALRAGKISRILPLYSPIDGYVTYINATIGQFLSPSDVLFRIADTNHLHVELTVFEKDVAALQQGQLVYYALPNEPAAQHKARIYLIGREISPERTVQVHAHMKEEDKNMLPGMYVQAQVVLNGQQVLALPETAVVQDNGHDFVFQYTGQVQEGSAVVKKFRMVPVQTGAAESGYVQVALPAATDTAVANFVTKGAYSLLSVMRNSEENGGHH